MLVTEQMDAMAQAISLLQENGYIEKELTLRQAYDNYLHPTKIPYEDPKLWDAIDKADILFLFQLNTSVGGNIVRQLQPRSIEELVACNALMRLMGEEGEERPADRYERLKTHIGAWENEMDSWGLSKEEQQVIKKYCGADYGAPSSQEVLMLSLMDENICGFTLAEANAARKTIAKKNMRDIPKLKEMVLSKAKNKKIGEYIWKIVVSPQLGYSFSRIHGYSYSVIACQAAYIATYFPSVIWNTAVLRVMSGLEAEASTNYGKIAKGIGDIKAHGTKVSLLDINKSEYLFSPDIENNAILYGMKAASNLNGDTIDEIISNRPYVSLKDFMEKVPCNKTVMISLIKGGAFDSFGEREDIMEEYIWSVCEPKQRLTMQNFNALIEHNLIPKELEFQKRVFIFNKMLKKECKINANYFSMNSNYYEFYEEFFDIDELVPWDRGLAIEQTLWKKLYEESMAPAKEYITKNKKELLEKLNDCLFNEVWEKYAGGNYSSWEIDSVGFYYHNHELENIKSSLYNIVDFNSLSESPQVDYYFKRNGNQIPIFKTMRICGTVIAKEDNKSSISLLTTNSGVVNVKFSRDYYARLNQRISEVGIDGVKHVKEDSWFKKGVMLVVNGFRREKQFVAKSYKKSNSHQCYKILDVKDNGEIEMTHLRYGETE